MKGVEADHNVLTIALVEPSLTMQVLLENVFRAHRRLRISGIFSDIDSATLALERTLPNLLLVDVEAIDMVRLKHFYEQYGVQTVALSGRHQPSVELFAELHQNGFLGILDKSELSRDPELFVSRLLSMSIDIFARKERDNIERVMSASGGQSRIPYPIPNNEEERLALVLDLGLANALHDKVFDCLTAFLAENARFGMALMTFFDRDTQWLKSSFGLSAERTAREVAFCNHTICQDDVFCVEDTFLAPLFSCNPLVTGSPYLRSYVGHPITSREGVCLGAMCLLDTRPRKITAEIRAKVRGIAGIASQIIKERQHGLLSGNVRPEA